LTAGKLTKKEEMAPKGYLKFPLEASHGEFNVGPLHDLLHTEAILEMALKV
jgi:hypothetical protein